MPEPLLIALDVGTGSVRAHLLDAQGTLVATAGRSVPVEAGPDGRAEMDPDQIWNAACAALSEVLAGTEPARIAALGVASALGYLTLGEQGTPLGPALLWMDRRAKAEAAHLASILDEDYLYRITGRNLDPEIFLAKLLWIRRHEPERFARTRCFVGIKDDLIRRLTGTIGSDPTHASYTMLYDVARRDWSAEILEATRVPRDMLPPLRRADEVAGQISREAATLTGLPQGLPVVTGASDGTVGCLAAGIVNARDGGQCHGNQRRPDDDRPAAPPGSREADATQSASRGGSLDGRRYPGNDRRGPQVVCGAVLLGPHRTRPVPDHGCRG